MNDEADQSAALHSLANGSLRVTEFEEAPYALHDFITWQRRWDDTPVASTALNVLALPVLGVLLAADFLAPLTAWLAAAFVWALWGAVGPRRDPSIHPAFPTKWRLAVLAALFVWAADRLRFDGPDVGFYYSTIALQFTNVALSIFAALLLWRIVAPIVPDTAARTAFFAAFLVGPWMFWARGLKYHMLGATVVALVLWLLTKPRTLRRDVLIGIASGFAVWVNIGVGIVIIGALAVTELPRLWTQRRELARLSREWMALVAGAVIGLLPSLIENQVLFGNPFLPFYFAEAAGNDTAGSSALRAVPGILAHIMHWNGLGDFLLNLLSVFTTGQRVEGQPFGILMLNPILIFAPAGVWLWGRRRIREPMATFAVCLVTVQAILMTNASVRQGAGLDVRLWFHVLPALLVLAAFGARPVLASIGRGDVRRIATIAIASAAVPYLIVGAIVAVGYQLAPELGPHLLRTLLGAWAVLLFILAFAWAAAAMRGANWRRAKVTTVAILIAAPLVWSIFFLWVQHPDLRDFREHEGAGMFVPGMDHVSSFAESLVFPPRGLPVVYDGNGTMVFHPDHGSCLVVPNPCPDIPMPDILRQRLRALENATREAATSTTS